VLTWLVQRPGYNHGDVKTLAWILGVIAELFLVAGGYLGGSIVFIYGHRVLKRPDTPLTDALIPGRADRVKIVAAGSPDVRTPLAPAERGDPQRLRHDSSSQQSPCDLSRAAAHPPVRAEPMQVLTSTSNRFLDRVGSCR